MFFQFYIEKEQADWFSHPKCSKNDWYAWTANLRSPQRNLIENWGAQYFLEKKRKKQPQPDSQKTKDMPLSRYFKRGNYCSWCFWKLSSTFLVSSPDTKDTKKKIIWLLLLNTHKFPVYPRQWCLECENQWWDAKFLGPARGVRPFILEARGESICWGGRLLPKRHVKPCWEGPSVVKWTFSQIKT